MRVFQDNQGVAAIGPKGAQNAQVSCRSNISPAVSAFHSRLVFGLQIQTQLDWQHFSLVKHFILPVLVPMFPHYASGTTGSCLAGAYRTSADLCAAAFAA